MRKPCEYVTAAMAKLRGSSLSGCSEVLRHGERAAKVTRVGQSQRGGDEVTEAEVSENCRVLAYVADFPKLKNGEAVELGNTLRVVTSCTTGPVNALLTVGLSAAFEKCPATYSGKRRENGTPRQFKHPIDVLALESASVPSDYGDAAAPTYVQSWIVCISADGWPEVSAPQVSDALEFADPHNSFAAVRLRVSDVKRHEGYWIITARPRGGA